MATDREHDLCYIKIIVFKENERVLGIHFLGPNAGEVMQGYAVAMKMNLKYSNLINTIGIHPTCSEELVKPIAIKQGEEKPVKEGC